MSQHPAAILRKATEINCEVVDILQESLPPLLAPILTNEGIDQVLKGCEMVKKYIQLQEPQVLRRIKLRFRAEKRYVRKVLFNSDTVVAVLKSDDYSGRKGITLYVCPDKGLVDKHGKVTCSIEELLPNESVDAFDAALGLATNDIAQQRRAEVQGRSRPQRPPGAPRARGGEAILSSYSAKEEKKKKKKDNKGERGERSAPAGVPNYGIGDSAQAPQYSVDEGAGELL